MTTDDQLSLTHKTFGRWIRSLIIFFFFLNDPAPPEFSPLPLPAPLPIPPRRAQLARALQDLVVGEPAGRIEFHHDERLLPETVREGTPLAPALDHHSRRRRGRDRKSTRLNSSHLVISYAVFCLKKKHKSK